MWTRFLNASIVTAIAAIVLTGCDATTTTQNGTTQKKSAPAVTGARQTGTHMR